MEVKKREDREHKKQVTVKVEPANVLYWQWLKGSGFPQGPIVNTTKQNFGLLAYKQGFEKALELVRGTGIEVEVNES